MLYRTLSNVARTFRLYAAQSVGAAPLASIPGRSVDNLLVSPSADHASAAHISVGGGPRGVALNPAGTRAYVANNVSDNVSVIATASNTVLATVALSALAFPLGIAVNPDGTRVYVVNNGSNSVSVINTATNKMIATIAVLYKPFGVTFNPAGDRKSVV